MSRPIICATCESFTLEGGQPAEGIGRCLAYNDTSHEPLVRWDHASTLLYGRARDMDERVQWIETRKRKEAGNVPGAG